MKTIISIYSTIMNTSLNYVEIQFLTRNLVKERKDSIITTNAKFLDFNYYLN